MAFVAASAGGNRYPLGAGTKLRVKPCEYSQSYFLALWGNTEMSKAIMSGCKFWEAFL